MRFAFATVFLLGFPLYAEVGNGLKSAKGFVEDFYRWYLPFAHSQHQGPAFESAIKRHSSIFSVELLRALREEAASQRKVPGEIVGLDWDPFLNTQDPDERYELGSVRAIGSHHLVSLHGVNGEKKRPVPDVIVEVAKNSGHWIFVNFHSVDGPDLISVLKKLKAARLEKPQK